MRSWLGVSAAVVLLAGCGTAAGATAGTGGTARTATPRPETKAAALAGRLVTEMRFPAGTKHPALSSTPKTLRNEGPSGGHWVHAERLLVAPVKPAAVWALLLAHKPFDDGGSMGSAADNGLTGTSVTIPAPEPGVTAAIGAVWVEPWHNGTTLIAAYGYATWLPARTAAEHLNPRGFRAVTITATTIVPHQHTVKRTFTSAAVIARITAVLNARPAAPELPVPCPMPATSHQVRFAPKASDGPVVTVTSSCQNDQITVRGVTQPLVWDTSGSLAALLSKLLPASR
jgi:hypothetical protein